MLNILWHCPFKIEKWSPVTLALNAVLCQNFFFEFYHDLILYTLSRFLAVAWPNIIKIDASPALHIYHSNICMYYASFSFFRWTMLVFFFSIVSSYLLNTRSNMEQYQVCTVVQRAHHHPSPSSSSCPWAHHHPSPSSSCPWARFETRRQMKLCRSN